MQATLDAASLRHVIKTLTCLAKYGDDLMVYATSESLTFSSTNSSMSSYCRFKYSRQFFSRYSLSNNAQQQEELLGPTGQLGTKALLSILKHRTVEKAVEKCELSMVEGGAEAENADDEDHDSLESKLIVRLHCKHGVVKTHRLLLNACTLVCPSMPDTANESKLTIVPKTLKDLLEHFPFPKGPKHDPKLIWKFTNEDIFLKGHEASLDVNAKGQLATELSVSSEEFEVYDVYDPPVTICFHIREFQATLALADTLALNLGMRFTDPASPVFLEIDGDLAESLFVISTTQTVATANGGGSRQQSRAASVSASVNGEGSQPQKGKKRALEQDGGDGGDGDEDQWQIRDGQERAASVLSNTSSRRKPVKAAERASVTREGESSSRSTPIRQSVPPASHQSMPPPSFIPRASFAPFHAATPRPASPARKDEPLFLPGSQLSQAAESAIRESGLGIEDMDTDEFKAMMEDEGEEFEVGNVQKNDTDTSTSVGWGERGGESGADADVSMQETDELADDDDGGQQDSFGLYEEDGTQFGPTQGSAGSAGSKSFRPLFDD